MNALARLAIPVTAMFCLALVNFSGAADDEKPGKGKRGEGFARGGAALLTQEAKDKLKLTDDQKEKVARIEKEYTDKQQEASSKARELFQSGDKDKLKDAFQNMRTDAEKLRNDSLAKV